MTDKDSWWKDDEDDSTTKGEIGKENPFDPRKIQDGANLEPKGIIKGFHPRLELSERFRRRK